MIVTAVRQHEGRWLLLGTKKGAQVPARAGCWASALHTWPIRGLALGALQMPLWSVPCDTPSPDGLPGEEGSESAFSKKLFLGLENNHFTVTFPLLVYLLLMKLIRCVFISKHLQILINGANYSKCFFLHPSVMLANSFSKYERRVFIESTQEAF